MPTAHRPVPTPRDRAERHVFERVPQLGAVERRVLALLELCDEERSAVGAEVGIDEEALRVALARGRKALRRTAGPLASGARCERAELLLAGVTGRAERRWLDIHLARCPRCVEHVELVDTALAELRASFAAAPVALLPPAEEPPLLLEGGEGTGRLRLVPGPAPAEVVAPAAEALPPAAEAVPAAPEPPAAVAPPPPVGRETHVHGEFDRPRGRAKRVAQRVAVLLVVLAVLGGIVAGAVALSGDDDQKAAPWSAPDAPVVHPQPLSGQ